MDFYDEDSDCLDEIGLVAITSLETVTENMGRIFKMRCNVKKGGDEKGQKVFQFDARSTEKCEEWMRHICEATHSLVLVPKDDGTPGFCTTVSENYGAEVRKKSMMKMFQSFGVSGGPMGLVGPARPCS